MKKLGIILMVTLMIVGLVGCASSGKAADGEAAAPYYADLSQMTVVALDGTPLAAPGVLKNPQPFTKNYDDLMILFGPYPADVDVTGYTRMTIRAKCFNADDEAIPDADGNAMVSVIEDIKGDIRGPEGEGSAKNLALKTYNLGGGSSGISKSRGTSARINVPPQAILIQNSTTAVKYIELTEVIFHNGNLEE